MNTLTELFAGSVAQRIGWALIHFLWQGAAVGLLLAVALTLLRRRSARARWILSCAALALMALLPVATALTVSVETPELSASAPPAPSASSTPTAFLADPMPPSCPGGSAEFPMGSASGPQPSPAAPLLARPTSAAKDEQIAAVSWLTQFQGAIQPVLPWATGVWLAGVIGMSVWHFGGLRQVRRMRRRGTRPAGADMQEMFDRVVRRLGVSRPVRLLLSMRVAVPVVVGWLRPVILLPVGAITGLTPRQWEAIIAHELAHIRRWDCLVQAIQAGIETLLFYHPAVWWVSRRIRQESEQCCDDLAVELCGDRRDYAWALAKVAELGAGKGRLAAAATAGDLLGRIQRLLGAERPRPLSLGRCISGAAALVTIVAVVIAVGVSYSSSQAPQTDLAHGPATRPAAGIGFGPVVERVVRAPAAGDDAFLDLDAGKLLAYQDRNGPSEPHMSKALSRLYRRSRWAKGSGADICLPAAGRFGKGVTGLIGLDMRMLPARAPFDRLTPRDVAEALADRAFYMRNEMRCAVDKLPASFLVETREGRLGVVQVVAVTGRPVGLKVRYRLAAAAGPVAPAPLWIAMAPSEPTVRSLKELRVLAAVEGLNQEAGRSGEWEIRTADNTRRVARLPYPWRVGPDQLLPDGKRIIGGTNRQGRFELNESRLRRVGPLAKGDYLLAWYVAGKRCSNVMAFRVDPNHDPGGLRLLELTAIEPGPGRRLPMLVLRARRHAANDPAPRIMDIAFATLNVDGQDRTVSIMAWTGPDGPLRVGGHYTRLLDLKRWDWYPKTKQAAPPIDPGKPHVVFAKVGRGKIRQTPPVRLGRGRPLGRAWARATPNLAPVASPEASISLSGMAVGPGGKPGRRYSVTLIGRDRALYRETADVAGKYRFRRIPPGTYTLNCNPPGKGQPELAIRGIVIQAGKRTRQDASLAGKFILVGRVTDAAGRPVRNTTIDLSCADRAAGTAFMDTTKTDDQGRYRLISPVGTVRYIGVNGRRIKGEMPQLSPGENWVDFPADKGHFRAEPVRRAATSAGLAWAASRHTG